MRTVVLAMLLLIGAGHELVSAQSRNNWWSVDWLDNKWLHFGVELPPAVVPLFPASDLTGFQGTIADTSGALILYTQTSGVRNGAGQLLPGAPPTWSTNLGCMGSVFTPAHGTTRYGMFLTAQATGSPVGGGFAEVDMDLNNGTGGVLGTGGRLLVDSVLTSVAAAPHGNGADYWGIFHGRGTNAWYAYRYGTNGMDTVPVVSWAGATAGQAAVWSSQIKCSPANDRIAIHAQTSDTLSVLAFDADLGTVTDLVDLVLPACYGGLEFSPSGRFLYALADRPDSTVLLQWDLWLAPGLIPASQRTVFAAPTSPNYCSGLLLAPDGRIYIPQDQTSFLTRIEAPDQPGLQCNVQVNAVDIAPGELTPFLNNHCKWYHDDPIALGSAELAARPELTVWPNPTAFTANVRLPEHGGPWTVQVIDGLGRVVHASPARQGGQVIIPTAGWPPGTYVVRAQGSRGILFARLVVHR